MATQELTTKDEIENKFYDALRPASCTVELLRFCAKSDDNVTDGSTLYKIAKVIQGTLYNINVAFEDTLHMNGGSK